LTTRTKFLGFTFVVVCLALFGWSYFCVGIPGIAEVSLYKQPVRSVVMDNCSGKGITALPSQEIPELVRSTLAAAEPISPEHYQVAGHSLCNSGRRQLRYVLDSVRLTQKFRLRFSAREIQTIYLNESYFGENAVGVFASCKHLCSQGRKRFEPQRRCSACRPSSRSGQIFTFKIS